MSNQNLYESLDQYCDNIAPDRPAINAGPHQWAFEPALKYLENRRGFFGSEDIIDLSLNKSYSLGDPDMEVFIDCKFAGMSDQAASEFVQDSMDFYFANREDLNIENITFACDNDVGSFSHIIHVQLYITKPEKYMVVKGNDKSPYMRVQESKRMGRGTVANSIQDYDFYGLSKRKADQVIEVLNELDELMEGS